MCVEARTKKLSLIGLIRSGSSLVCVCKNNLRAWGRHGGGMGSSSKITPRPSDLCVWKCTTTVVKI